MTELQKYPVAESLIKAAEKISENDGLWDGRNKAFDAFLSAGFPHKKMEKWRSTDLSEYLNAKYTYIENTDPVSNLNINQVFHCSIENFETALFTLLNGAYVYNTAPLTVMENGVIAGSLRQAWHEFPQLVGQYLSKLTENSVNGLVSLNSALATAGFFIYIPDNIVFDKPVQLVNLVNTEVNPFLQIRNLIVLGKNSKLQFLQCDDSIKDKNSFLNIVSEFHLAEGSHLDHYKLQNKDDSAVMTNTSFFGLQRDAKLSTNTITFNGGNIRNESIVNLNGEGAEAEIMGLYLVDRKQHVDNQVLVRHNVPNCTSHELFKGILDDEASVAFNGHIIVKPDAQKTNAFQSNKNILLTDTAQISTKPFLEIYADDVKCSHGATVGQLDDNAMFYLKQRGICERNAKMLLMYAFADEVVRKITVESLYHQTAEMVSRRLKGELSVCDQCMLHCGSKHPIEFEIDVTRI
ncbi:MAG TPA: Fe-S cluster assembly protein SufD [Bacteroidales bacterium]|nr:Fe-S cluster assembly protein SufD [Bacteroidales bacterium]